MTSRNRTHRTTAAALLAAALLSTTACSGGGGGSAATGSPGPSTPGDAGQPRQAGRYRVIDDLCAAVGDPGLPGQLTGSIPVTSEGIETDPSKTLSCSYDASSADGDWRVVIDATVFEAARGCHWLEVSADVAKSPLDGPKPTETRTFTPNDGGGLGQQGYQSSVRHPRTDSATTPVDRLTFQSAVCDGNLNLAVDVDYGAGPGLAADYPGALDKAEAAARKKAAELLKRAEEKLSEHPLSPQPTAS
ncbi:MULTISPECIES: hypothetical protein [Kitasatospora]|uniref:DUF3558 domain-containing protein n=1 Tax=Kitasatospora setae (strain ATCC 33774 / DSM 43861 / JCM 3304 / KCC A-0304 / NBRC 14216 / KM-6054) TaxID=452652 RepID=E4N3I7_KITSK|nr:MULTISPECIES: hypothetical protein [Kitasatospora]BAJ32721.1 hypothetical protein KSE_69630 [Kitasatospora setae KM-6054]